jgi:flagellar M-ring protein FliF
VAFWDSFLTQVRQLWGGLAAAQRAVLVAAMALLAVGFVALAFWAGTPPYELLYGRLSTEDASRVTERLRGAGVPYRIEDGGRSVLVPADRVYDLRLSLAGEGIPQGGVVGFEIFDRSGFGMTDFAQKVNYARALEGELTRTIRRLEGVEGARVHLVLPERRLFETESPPASASVVLQLAPGRQPTAKQIQGVVYLVSSSVQELAPERVTVVDTGGNLLHRAAGDETGLLAASQLEFKRAYEKEAEGRIREMLERVLGAGAAVVQVAAQFDFDTVEETSEIFDPDAVAVRSEERVTESQEGPSGSSRDAEKVNYEVSRRLTRVQRSPGSLRRLTVAVAVDGTYAEQAGPDREFVPRGAEELNRIRSLVEKAVGFEAGRGDEVEVTSIPFRPAEKLIEPEEPRRDDVAREWMRYGLAAFLALVVVLGVVRPLLRRITSSRPPEMTGPVTVAEMERRLAGKASAPQAPPAEPGPSGELRGETLRSRLLELVEAEPEVAAQLVRGWLTEE